MAYKDMDQAVADEFLRAADRMRGLVLTVAIDSRIKFMSADRQPEDNVLWKPRIYDRAIRYSNFVGLLVSGLSREGQEVGWCTDRDEIAANRPQQERLAQVAKDVMFPYLAHRMGKLVVKDNSNEPDMVWSDFLSVADLSAGAFAKVLDNHRDRVVAAGQTVMERFLMDDVDPKARQVLNWYAEKGKPLRKLFMLIDPNLESDRDTWPHLIHWPEFVTPPQKRYRKKAPIPS